MKDRNNTLHTAGRLASGVASEIARPLRSLRENLAEMVERLDHFHHEKKGPAPYPWKATRVLREELAEAYLECRRVTRLADDLAHAVTAQGSAEEAVDLNRLVDSAINLAKHRVAASTELFVDLGTLPVVRTVPSAFVLIVAHWITVAADSARRLDGAALSIKTRRESHDARDDVVISIVHNGAGAPTLAKDDMERSSLQLGDLGGTFVGRSEEDAGSAFEIRIPVAR